MDQDTYFDELVRVESYWYGGPVGARRVFDADSKHHADHRRNRVAPIETPIVDRDEGLLEQIPDWIRALAQG